MSREGFQQPDTGASDFNAMCFVVRELLGRIATCTLVKVLAVDIAAGTVDIQPMVQQIDVNGKGYPHGITHSAPYFRLQGGASAVIIDPVVGDIGIAVFASRDISTVAQTKAPGLPGSWRQYSWSDALYIGGLLNGTPTQFVRFTDDGIELTSPNLVTITAPTTTIDGDLTVTGSFDLQGDGTIDGKDWATHHHSGVTVGGGTSGPPS